MTPAAWTLQNAEMFKTHPNAPGRMDLNAKTGKTIGRHREFANLARIGANSHTS